MTAFKVPKLNSENNLTRMKKDDPFLVEEILPKFRKNMYSQKSTDYMEIIQAWKIANHQAEKDYINKRSELRKVFKTLTEDYGFIYYPNTQLVSKMVSKGRIKNGNITDSQIATSSMGVSICIYADVYHPGTLSGAMPQEGVLVVVKFIRGKANYVTCDARPIDPQPNYNFHVSKSTKIDSSMKVFNAFHKSQIFLYEYDEDYNIKDYPSTVLPIAALHFKWNGPSLFKISSRKQSVNEQSSQNSSVNKKSFKIPTKQSNLTNIKRSSIHSRDSTYNLRTTIGICKFNLNCSIYMYILNKVIMPFMHQSHWKVTDLIQADLLLNELKQFQFRLNERITPNNPINLLNKIAISPQEICYLGPSKMNYVESISKLTNKDSDIYKFIIYFRIVPDKRCQEFVELADLLNVSTSVARISCDPVFNSQMFIFPDGPFSSKLGINSISTSDQYFHGIALIKEHPEFMVFHNLKDIYEEQFLYFTAKSTRSILSHNTPTTPKSPFSVSPTSPSMIPSLPLSWQALEITQRDQFEIQNILTNQIAQKLYEPIKYSRLKAYQEESQITVFEPSESATPVKITSPIDCDDITESQIVSVPMDIDPDPIPISQQFSPKTRARIKKDYEKRKKKHIEKNIGKKLLETFVNSNKKPNNSVDSEIIENSKSEVADMEIMRIEQPVPPTEDVQINETVMEIDSDNIPIVELPNRSISYDPNDRGFFRPLIFVQQEMFTVQGIKGQVVLNNGKFQCNYCPANDWAPNTRKFVRIEGIPHMSLYKG